MNERLAFVGRALLRSMRDADSDAAAGFARLRETLTGAYRPLADQLQRDFASDDAVAAKARERDALGIALRSVSLARANGGRITAEVWTGLERNYSAAVALSDALRRAFAGTLFIAMATFAVALVVGATYLLWVLPEFQVLYQSMNAELPALTGFLLAGAGPLLLLLVVALVLASATLLTVKPAWLYRSRERTWNPLALATRVLTGNQVAACHRRLAFVQYAITLIDGGIAGRKALGIAAGESGAFGPADFDSGSDRPEHDELSSAVHHAERLGQLRQELSEQLELRSQALARASEDSQIRASFVIRGLLYVLIAALLIAMYLPIFQLGAAI